MWLLLATLIITDPYKGIDYQKVNSYEIKQETYLEDVIHVTLPDSSDDYGNNSEYSQDSDYSEEDEEEDEEANRQKIEDEYQKELNQMYPYIFPKRFT